MGAGKVVTEQNSPWITCRGEPYQVIDSLELLATLYGAMAFWPEGAGKEGKAIFTASSIADHRGNMYVVSKLMTTKFPLCAVLLELAEQLEARHSWLKLEWAPRQQNEEADALTNGNFDQFDPALRMAMDPTSMNWKVMDTMLEAGGSMVEEIRQMRAQKRAWKDQLKQAKRKQRKKAAGARLKTADLW